MIENKPNRGIGTHHSYDFFSFIELVKINNMVTFRPSQEVFTPVNPLVHNENALELNRRFQGQQLGLLAEISI